MPHSTTRYSQTIAIIGAGATGTLVAMQLLRQADAAGTAVDIRLIDPVTTTGRGLAYSTTDPDHLLNVPAGRMSAFPDLPNHFIEWLAANHGVSDPHAFAPRAWYGDYLAATLNQSAATSRSRLSRVHEEAVEVHDRGSDFTVRLSGGGRFRASHVVLAAGSPRAGNSWVPSELLTSEQFVPDPWNAEDLARATRDASTVLLVGSGLTMVDIALTLSQEGCNVVAVSRSGLTPEAHAAPGAPVVPPPHLPAGQLTLSQVRTIVAQQIDLAERQGATWRAGVDSMRSVTNEIWSRLSPSDREEFLRTDMRTWEVARHRMAPDVAAQVNELMARGRLRIQAGTVVAATDLGREVEVSISDGTHLTVGAVVNCTGPALVGAGSGVGGMLLANLVDEGLVHPHPLNFGLDVDPSGHAINALGTADPRMLVVGPLRRGRLWETTAIPEIRTQAADAACTILAQRRPPASGHDLHDLYGLAVSADAPAVDLYNDALGRILRVQSGALESLVEAVERDDSFALGHAALAVLGHEFAADVDVSAHLRAARMAADVRGTDRERAFVDAFARRVGGDSAALLGYLSEYPRDVLALSIAIPTIAFSGAYEVPAQAWACLDRAAPHFGDDWWFTGLLAFARQEQGRMAEAERLAEHSLAIEPRGGTAVHARAHVYVETGDHAAGLKWIDPWIATCGRDAVHRAHFSWHAALHELALNDTDAVIRRYHRQLSPPAVVGTRAMVDSAALLWRLQIEEVAGPLPSPEPIVRVAGRELTAPSTAFAAMHAVITWACAGNVDALGRLADYCRLSSLAAMNQTVAAMAEAFAAYLLADFDRAADDLLAIRPTMAPVGGSDAQRGVVEDTAIAALIQAGRGPEAARLLDERMSRRARPRDVLLRSRAALARSAARE